MWEFIATRYLIRFSLPTFQVEIRMLVIGPSACRQAALAAWCLVKVQGWGHRNFYGKGFDGRHSDFGSFGRMALPHWPAVIRVWRREINLIRSCFCKPASEAGIRHMKLIWGIIATSVTSVMPSYLLAFRAFESFGSGRVQDIGVGQWIWALNLVQKKKVSKTRNGWKLSCAMMQW